MVPFFLRKSNKNFTPKMSQFGFFQLIKNYAETTLLIDTKTISQEASYAAQQCLIRVAQIVENLILNRDSGFYKVKILFIDYQVKFFFLLYWFLEN